MFVSSEKSRVETGAGLILVADDGHAGPGSKTAFDLCFDDHFLRARP